jgi:Nif-specific regulatory protein
VERHFLRDKVCAARRIETAAIAIETLEMTQAILTIEAGLGEPRVCDLSGGGPMTLGRNRGNEVVVQDEHASRRHAEIYCREGCWFIRDLDTLNGTHVNGEIIAGETALADGAVIAIGKTCLRFRVQTTPNGNGPTVALPPAVEPDADPTVFCRDELATLCQFMAGAVRETDPRILLRRALETVHVQTEAALAGFLSLDPEEPLPRMVCPELARVDLQLSRHLTQEVQRQGRSIWLGGGANAESEAESLLAFADALCVPLRMDGAPVGALHVYKAGGAFTERDVRFCEVLAGHLANSLHLLRVRRTLEAENERLREHAAGPEQLLGSSPAMAALRQTIARLAGKPCTVLITGESGVGKELVALALHRQSPRRQGPLVAVNCAAIAPGLLESELFGHRRGSFTGSCGDHPGYFEQADDGTLFLDEIGELSLECQAKLLRVLEQKRFRPIGATADVQVDVRVVAATHRDLEQLVRAGNFRHDLFFRLQGIQVHVPPLREHANDIPELTEHFLANLGHEWGRQLRLSSAALEKLRAYPWPGNVRQLRYALENAAAQTDRAVLEPQDLRLPMPEGEEAEPGLNLEALEIWAIRQALERTAGKMNPSARLLGINRETLRYKLRKYGIGQGEES